VAVFFVENSHHAAPARVASHVSYRVREISSFFPTRT
jgi:hypothetical protein